MQNTIRTPKSQALVAAALAAVIALGAFTGGCSSRGEATGVWGRADAKEVDVNSKIPGRVVEILVKEGQEVKAGQALARIDNRELKAKAEQAKAQKDAAAAQASAATTATELQDQATQAGVTSAQKQLEKAAADLALAEKTFNRYQSLYDAGAVSTQVLDESKLRYQAAGLNHAQSQAALQAAEANLLQRQLSRENAAASAGKLAQAAAAVDEISTLVDETEIRSPIDGVVTGRMVEIGELVATGTPLMTVQDTKDNWINVKVKETDLAKYQLNAQVKLRGQDKNLQLTGTIVDISRKPEFATQRATNERGEYDITTYNVKIQVNSPELRPGMRLEVSGGV